MTTSLDRIGFMQGRLSAMVDGKIQAFPWNEWREEFPRAKALGLTRMEWTIDQDRLRENPLTTAAGQTEIRDLSRHNALRISSLTGDCFMQAPFWKTDGEAQKALVADLDLVLASCSTLGIEFVVIPLVDNGKIENARTGGDAAARSARRVRRRCRSKASRSFSNPTCRRPRSRNSSQSFRPRCSASTTTSATALRSAMTARRRFPPTRREFSMCT